MYVSESGRAYASRNWLSRGSRRKGGREGGIGGRVTYGGRVVR